MTEGSCRGWGAGLPDETVSWVLSLRDKLAMLEAFFLPLRLDHFKVYWGTYQARERKFLKWNFPHFGHCHDLNICMDVHMLKPLTPRDDCVRWWGVLGGDSVMGWSKNGISTVIQGLQRAPSSLPPRKDTARSLQRWRRPSPEPEHAAILFLDFQLPELWEINFCCICAAQSVVFSLSSPDRLR